MPPRPGAPEDIQVEDPFGIPPIRLSDKELDGVTINPGHQDMDPDKLIWIRGILNHVFEYLVEVNPPELRRELPTKLDMMNIVREYNTLRELRVVFNFIFRMACRVLEVEHRGLFLVNNPGTGFFELVLGYGFKSKQYQSLYEELIPHLQKIKAKSLKDITVFERSELPFASRLQFGESHLIIIPLTVENILWGEIILFSTKPPDIKPIIDNLMRVVREISASVIRTTISGRMPYELTFTDSLTGTYNYGLWWKRLDEELNRAKRHGNSLTLIVFDVDNFNRINQNHGYFIGDQFLRIIADRIKMCVRAFDIVGRIGGEEFGVVLIGSDKPNSRVVANRILKAVAGIPDETRIQLNHPLTLSGGISGFPDDTDDPELMVEMAKTALVSAKIMGGNRIKSFESSEE